MSEPQQSKVRRRKLTPPVVAAVALLLAAPVVALLWVGSYTSASPRLWGFPFFYWYQIMWIILVAFTTGLAYVLVSHTGTEVDVDEESDR